MSSPVRIAVGDQFGLWHVLHIPSLHRKNILCQCQCLAIHKVNYWHLLNGKTLGCRRCRPGKLTHGAASKQGQHRREYVIWGAMIQRCCNANSKGYPRYGGRGITICDQWRHSFPTFLHDMGPRPSTKHSVERKNNDLGYTPDNCVWATPGQQLRNTSRNHVITFRNLTQPICDWSIDTGIPAGTIKSRLSRRWSIERALTTPTTKIPRTLIKFHLRDDTVRDLNILSTKFHFMRQAETLEYLIKQAMDHLAIAG